MKKNTITAKINIILFELLEQNPKGLRWSQLLSETRKTNMNLHPKTINGCIWKLARKFPNEIYKPSKGLFRLSKYKFFKV